MVEFYLILSSFKDYPNQLCSTSKNHLLNQSTDLWLFAFLRVECYVISIFHNKKFAISKALDNSANQILLFLPLKWARSWIGQKFSSPVWLNVWHLFLFQTKKIRLNLLFMFLETNRLTTICFHYWIECSPNGTSKQQYKIIYRMSMWCVCACVCSSQYIFLWDS